MEEKYLSIQHIFPGNSFSFGLASRTSDCRSFPEVYKYVVKVKAVI